MEQGVNERPGKAVSAAYPVYDLHQVTVAHREILAVREQAGPSILRGRKAFPQRGGDKTEPVFLLQLAGQIHVDGGIGSVAGLTAHVGLDTEDEGSVVPSADEHIDERHQTAHHRPCFVRSP